jgi:hypothetical protein
MAELEAWAVLIGLRDVLPLCAPAAGAPPGEGRTLRVMCDNQSVSSMLRRLSSRSPRCNNIIAEIAVLTTIFGVTLDVRWCASADNGAADALSRARDPTFSGAALQAVMEDWSAREPSSLHWLRRPAPHPELFSILQRAVYD